MAAALNETNCTLMEAPAAFERMAVLEALGLYEDPALSQLGYGLSVRHVVVLMAVWFVVNMVAKRSITKLLDWACTSVDFEKARLPPQMPMDRNSFSQWPTLVADASEVEIEAFLAFRGVKGGRAAAALEAVAYRAELFDQQWIGYMHVRHNLNEPCPYPVAMPSWNSWKGWWREIGPALKEQWTGQFVYGLEHLLVAFMAAYYSGVTPDPVVFMLALYLEASFNLIEMGLFLSGYWGFVSADLCAWSGPRYEAVVAGSPAEEMRGMHRIMILHHLTAAGLELVEINVAAAPMLACEFLIAMLGTTAVFHVMSVNSDVTPLKENALAWFGLSAVTLALITWYRFLAFIPLSINSLMEAHTALGPLGVVFVGLLLAAFTKMNVDFMRLYKSKTKMAWKLLLKEVGRSCGKTAM